MIIKAKSSLHPLKHVAIIMDGNNRWAKQRGLSGVAGHKAGAERIRDILPTARNQGVETVSLFAFSSENWLRPAIEVRGLMSLFSTYLKQEAKLLRDDGIKLRVIGSKERFSDRLNRQIKDAERLTQSGELNLNLYMDYGGRWEIAQVAQKIAENIEDGSLSSKDISAENIDSYFTHQGLTPPDLCIRTAGEQRISNFMLWQMAYTELYFTDCFWPDFDKNAFEHAVEDYYSRQRRFGSRLTKQESNNN
ncbi:MAG: polyprenyl diphosphate synthase [Porticoccaceae bacterium]|nr:polyprenyl diphosphate synthase [Porticoccaceae bacterium]